MTILQIVTLFAAISNIFLGFLVLKRNFKSWVNINFLVLTFLSGIWLFANYIMVSYPNLNPLFLIRLTYATGELAATGYLSWTFVFCRGKSKIIYLFYFSGLIFGILCLTPLVIKNIGNVTVVGSSMEYGPLFLLNSLFFIIVYMGTLSLLITSLRKASGIKRSQVLFVLLGIILFGVVTTLVSFVLPLLFKISSFANLDAPSSIFFVAFSAYAIIKHRLMDIRLFVLRSVAYSVTFGLIIAGYVIVGMTPVF